MARYPGLVRRGKRGTYWFRRRVPLNLVTKLGIGPEINKSLGTRDDDEAVERWSAEDKKARRLFAEEASRTSATVTRAEIDHAEIIAAFEDHIRSSEHEYRYDRSSKEGTKRSPNLCALAERYRARLKNLIKEARARAVTLCLFHYDVSCCRFHGHLV